MKPRMEMKGYVLSLDPQWLPQGILAQDNSSTDKLKGEKFNQTESHALKLRVRANKCVG